MTESSLKLVLLKKILPLYLCILQLFPDGKIFDTFLQESTSRSTCTQDVKPYHSTSSQGTVIRVDPSGVPLLYQVPGTSTGENTFCRYSKTLECVIERILLRLSPGY